MAEPRLSEFELIRRYFARMAPADASVVLGIGDDAALLVPPAGEELAVTTDTLIAGRHFPQATPPADVGWKSLAVNLSDLAAMGAQPLWFTLALTLPEADERWLEGFSAGLLEQARLANVILVGGDTTRGPLSITITAMGSAPAGAALRRSGARPGDRICVTGTLGDAALALARLDDLRLPPATRARLARPTPRLAAGLALRGLASAAIDLSDGLIGDLPHILEASNAGADVCVDDLPMSAGFEALKPKDRLRLQLAGGDDYELCVCISREDLVLARQRLDLPLTDIGRITSEPGLRLHDASGKPVGADVHGYEHFS